MSGLDQRPANPFPLAHGPRPDKFPLSSGQEWLWQLHQQSTATENLHVIGGWRVAKVDPSALSAALHNLVRRHEILRTQFVPQHARSAVQHVVDDVSVDVVRAGREWRAALDQSVADRFDLVCPPLVRVISADLDDGAHGILAVVHHIVTDRWSMDIFARDLFEMYDAALSGRKSRLPELAVQYGDYTAWQRRLLDSTLIQPHLEFWQWAVSGNDRPGGSDRAQPAEYRMVGRHVSVELSAEATEGLTALAWRTRASPAIVVTAALAAVLSAAMGRTEIVIGAVTSDRPRPELQQLIGFFINTVALRVSISRRGETFRELIKRTRDAWMAAFAHQDVPLARIAALPGTNSSERPPPMFDVVVNHGGGWPSADEHPAIPPEWAPDVPATATYELSLGELMVNTLVVGGRLRVALVYDSSTLDYSTVAAVGSQFIAQLEKIVGDPDHGVPATGAL